MKKAVALSILISLLLMTTLLNGNLKSSSEPDSIINKSPFGICIYATVEPYWPFDSLKYRLSLDSAKSLGVKYIRTPYVFTWYSIQSGGKDSFNFTEADYIYSMAKRRGLKILPIIGYTPSFAQDSNYKDYKMYAPHKSEYDNLYIEYLKKIINRYDFKYIEFWNEPDLSSFYGTPGQYIHLFNLTDSVIESIDSNIKIGAPCLSYGYSNWKYYDTTGDSIAYIDYGSWDNKFKSIVIDSGLVDKIDFITFHVYSTVENFMNSLDTISSILISSRNEKKPIWFTEVGFQGSDHMKVETDSYPDTLIYLKDYYPGYGSRDTIEIDNTLRLIKYAPDSNKVFSDSVFAKWKGEWKDTTPGSWLCLDTFLVDGTKIIIESIKDSGRLSLPDTVTYTGGPIILNDSDTIIDIGDSIAIYHVFSDTFEHKIINQGNNYQRLLDLLTTYFVNNPDWDIKILPFCLDPIQSNRYWPPRINCTSIDSHKYYKLYIKKSKSVYTIIDTNLVPFPAYYTYKSHISNWHDLMYDSIAPSLSVPNYKHPDIIGTLHWTASDNQGIYSQKLFINNDTIQLDTAVRSFSGTYNGWYTYKGLEVRDYAWNKASDNDSVRVALFDDNSSDFTINLYSQRDIGWKYNVYLNINFPPYSPNSRTSVYFTIYYKKNNGQWKTAIAKRGYNPYLLDSTAYRDDDFTAFVTNYLYNGDSVFTDYSNVCSLSIGCINPLLLSKNTDGFIPEVELFTLENKQSEEYSYILKHCPNNNNVSFRIINGENYTYIDNIKLYAIDSKKNINLNDTKGEIDITYIKSIKTELEQESLDSRLNSIDEKYYILKPNDTLDFTFRNINRELSKGYTRDYVMEITGYQGDVIYAGIAKSKKELNNDVKMIRSVGSSLEIEFSSIRKREINLKVCDLSGRIVRNEKIMLDKGRKSYLIKSLPRGIYLIQANSKSFKGIILK